MPAGILWEKTVTIAFGETRLATGTMHTDKLYTGQREVTDLGIYYYNARFYSPYLNHFIQPDSIVPDPYNPQDWNRYAYVRNNPIRYNDPSGHMSCDTDNCKQATGKGLTMQDIIQDKYTVQVEGKWKKDEVISLYKTLNKAAAALGGVENLNDAILTTAKNNDPNATYITYLRVATDGYIPGDLGSAAAAWCGNGSADCPKNTIVVSDKTFSDCYQTSTCPKPDKENPGYTRPVTWNSTDLGSQFTMAHELGTCLA